MRLIRSFGYALRGIGQSTRDRNMRIHILATVVVVGWIVALSITGVMAAVVITNVAMVLGFEVMNVAIEKLCDLVADSAQLPYPDERIKHIKDIAAGAVLVVAIGAAITGGIVFFPFIWG